jgi:hypothetical protein
MMQKLKQMMQKKGKRANYPLIRIYSVINDEVGKLTLLKSVG